MSFYYCKNISIKPKKNDITVTIAVNNLRPLWFETASLKRDTDKCFDDTLRCLYDLLLDGEIHPYPSCNHHLWEFVMRCFNDFIKEKEGKTIKELWGDDDRYKEIKDKYYEEWKEGLALMLAPHGSARAAEELYECNVIKEKVWEGGRYVKRNTSW